MIVTTGLMGIIAHVVPALEFFESVAYQLSNRCISFTILMQDRLDGSSSVPACRFGLEP